MRRFLRDQLEQLICDDLFLRVVSALMGLVIGGIGVAMVIAGTSPETRAWLSWFNLLYWPAALLQIIWGALLLSRCAVPAKSRIARIADKWLPDPAGLEEGIAVVLVFVVPAVLLTLLLRLAGIRGQRMRAGR